MIYLTIAISIPTLAANIVAEVTPISEAISSIQMDDSGLLIITYFEKSPATLQLTETNRKNLLEVATLLSRIEIQNDRRTHICKMTPEISDIQKLSVYDAASQSIKLVLSSPSCTQSVYTHPKDSYLITAAVLKAQMIVLAQQANLN